MRRSLAALLLGAVSLAALVPVAAGATELPKVPFGSKKPAIRLACGVVRHDGAPAVSCSWSTPLHPATADALRPAPYRYRLGRIGRGGRTVVYRGSDTTFVDTTVEPGHKYGYRVQAFNANERPVAGSRLVRVAVPRVPRDEAKPEPNPQPQPTSKPEPKPVPVPAPKPKPEPRPVPLPVPEPKRVPVPGSKVEPMRVPLPAPKPEPRPEPTPVPDPKPAPPAIARMKLACALQRFDATTEPITDKTATSPAGPVVVCEWAAPSDLKVAGYRLWRADRPEGTKQVIFRSADATRYVDRTVSEGHGYLYMVQAVGADGRVVAQSDGVAVSFPATADAKRAAA